jgi:hypothetical protein
MKAVTFSRFLGVEKKRMEGLRKRRNGEDKENDNALLDALTALRAGDFGTVQHLVKTTMLDVCSGMTLHFGARRTRQHTVVSTNLFLAACKMGFDCSWQNRGLVATVIVIIETGRIKSDFTESVPDVTRFNMAWHCIPFVCKSILRSMGLYCLLPMFSTPHTIPKLLWDLHVQLAQRVLALRDAWAWSREEHCEFPLQFRVAVREILLCRLRVPLFRQVPKDVIIYILLPQIARVWAQ